MVNEIGEIIIGYIKQLPFVENISGVVKQISYKTETGVKKTFPASCILTAEQCKTGDYKDLCPDNSKKSIIYLEDKGARLIKKEGPMYFWRASFDLVCWLNLPALGFSDCSYSAIAIMAILSKLPGSPVPSNGIYSRLNYIPVGEVTKAQNPFAKYTYDETINQFLMKPYDYFVLNIDVEYCIDKRCLTAQSINPLIPCK